MNGIKQRAVLLPRALAMSALAVGAVVSLGPLVDAASAAKVIRCADVTHVKQYFTSTATSVQAKRLSCSSARALIKAYPAKKGSITFRGYRFNFDYKSCKEYPYDGWQHWTAKNGGRTIKFRIWTSERRAKPPCGTTPVS